MKKYIQITVVIFSFLFLVLIKRMIVNNSPRSYETNSQNNSNSTLKAEESIVSVDETLPTNSSPTSEAPTPEITPLTTNESLSNSLPAETTSPSLTKKANKYKDGTFTGSIEDAAYGEIQVKISVASGKISNVIFLKYPNSDPTSRYINTEAIPQLKSEAIKSQSAQVDGVTGASFTSQSFRDSLRNALVKASS